MLPEGRWYLGWHFKDQDFRGKEGRECTPAEEQVPANVESTMEQARAWPVSCQGLAHPPDPREALLPTHRVS